ncbi:MAG TPA: leucyl/phenylalanyl-tRNA--protein transferase [Burkholderiaceae bacterium]|nr:leucyl/phenylalanyl-tRNA--protein transferase [Burkholderiaceae bacterium]
MKSKNKSIQTPIKWLKDGEDFPPIVDAMGHDSPYPGLLAVGGCLDTATLLDAYSNGIFPWFSEGQPVLWWSTDPRMVLQVTDFKLHKSLKKTLKRFISDQHGAAKCEIRIDCNFEEVIQTCASKPRKGQGGTWIGSEMVNAYIALHQAGYAHSVETWINNKLAGGLYLVNIGTAVFGESMFANVSDASKIAVAALVCFCRENHIEMIDCQQETAHLASLGAKVMPRDHFSKRTVEAIKKPSPVWQFRNTMWQHL